MCANADPFRFITACATLTLCAQLRVLDRSLPLAELPSLYAAADALVAPSRGEGCVKLIYPRIRSRASAHTCAMHMCTQMSTRTRTRVYAGVRMCANACARRTLERLPCTHTAQQLHSYAAVIRAHAAGGGHTSRRWRWGCRCSRPTGRGLQLTWMRVSATPSSTDSPLLLTS